MGNLDDHVFKQLCSTCHALEDEAGLTTDLAQAPDKRFIPLGALNHESSRQQSLANEPDCLRNKTREAYFSVRDTGLRKRLIEAHRKVANYVQEVHERDVSMAMTEVAAAAIALQRLAWPRALAALVVVGSIMIGHGILSITGAIAGAVGGFFLSQRVIARARSEATALLEKASVNLDLLQKQKAEHSVTTEFFSLEEEASGEPDSTVQLQHQRIKARSST